MGFKKTLASIVLSGAIALGLGNKSDAVELITIPAGGGDISYTYQIGKYEITQQEWFDVMGTWPSRYDGVSGGNLNGTAGDREIHPVEQIYWEDAANFCNALSIQEGLPPVYDSEYNIDSEAFEAGGYRLPFRDEWKKAGGWDPRMNDGAGGFHTQGFGRDTIEKLDACFWNSDFPDRPDEGYYPGDNGTNPIGWYNGINPGFYNPEETTNACENYYGIFDMTGNVYEYVNDFSQGQRISVGGGFDRSRHNGFNQVDVGILYQGGVSNGFRIVQIPEPSTAGLLGLGSLALLKNKRRKDNIKNPPNKIL